MLRRRLGLLQAVSLNMSMMVGVGPFITIPLFVSKMAGPQALVGWLLGAAVALCDGFVWSELAAAFPGTGGTYHFFDAVYGERKIGRLLKFLFVWQFLFSAPLEVATGAIGLSYYAGFLFPGLNTEAWGGSATIPTLGPTRWSVTYGQILAVAEMAGVTALAYRKVEAAGRLMVVFWCGMLATVAWVAVDAARAFDPAVAFDFPPDAWTVDRKFALGLGAALGVAMYDYLGYYQICYLGDEVEAPSKTIPRSILLSVAAVSALYFVMNLGILGVIPWREVVASKHVASDLMQRLHGPGAASVVTVLIIWTALASTFAALLGYSRVPYASARSGHFFLGLAKTHPRGDFPHRSLLLVGGLSAAACLFPLETVIAALLTSRILIQFVAQAVTVVWVRSRLGGELASPFRMPLYPVPAAVAVVGWLFVFGTSDPLTLVYGLGSLALGLVVFSVWDRSGRSGAPNA